MSESAPLHRLHPATFFIVLASIARRFLLPTLVVFVVGSNQTFEMLLMILAIPAFLWAIMRYLSVKIGMTDHHLVVAEGILDRQEQRIPLQRIQSIETRRTLVHRLFDVDDVIVHTGGGSGAEATLSAVGGSEVAELRSRLGRLSGSADADHAEPASESVDDSKPAAETPVGKRAGWRQLVGYGLVYHRGFVVLAVILGVLWQADVVDWGQPFDLLEWWWQQTQESIWLGGFLLVIGLFSAWLILRLGSVVWSLLMLHGFTLRLQDEHVHLDYGLLFHRKISLPESRFHVLELTRGWAHRHAGAVTVEAWTAGTWAGGDDEDSGDSELDEYFKTQILLPFAAEREATALVQELMGEPNWRQLPWQPIELRPMLKLFLRACLIALPICTVVSLIARPWGVLIVPMALAVCAWFAVVEVACTHYAVTDHGLWLRRGFLRRRWRVVHLGHIQAIEVVESPLDRRRRMAHLYIDAASSPGGSHAIRIPYLLRQDAERVSRELSQRTADTEG